MGRAILQEEFSHPSYLAGVVDASVRTYVWSDVRFDDLPNIGFVRYGHPVADESAKQAGR